MKDVAITLDGLSEKYDGRLREWNRQHGKSLRFNEWIGETFRKSAMDLMLRRYSSVGYAPKKTHKSDKSCFVNVPPLDEYIGKVLEQMQIGAIVAYLGFDRMIEVGAGVGIPAITARMYDPHLDIAVVEPDMNANKCRGWLMEGLYLENNLGFVRSFEDLQKLYSTEEEMPDAVVVSVDAHISPVQKFLDFIIEHNLSLIYMPCNCKGQKQEEIDLAFQTLQGDGHSPFILMGSKEGTLERAGILSYGRSYSKEYFNLQEAKRLNPHLLIA